MQLPIRRFSKKFLQVTSAKSKSSYLTVKKKGALGLLEDVESFRQSINHDITKVNKIIKDINVTKPIAFVFNVSQWKREYVRQFLPEYRLIYLSLNADLNRYNKVINFLPKVCFIMWGRKVPQNISAYAIENNINIYHIEDGFIRSVGLGADKVAPVSLCLDKTGFYYDSSLPSDLENILNHYSFDADYELMKQAEEAINFIKKNKINKYNHTQNNIAESLYGKKTRKRILVLGQVEDDQSVLFGCQEIITNLELIKIAIRENPNAQVIFKPHPDVLKGKRKEISDSLNTDIDVEVYHTNMSMFDALTGVDRVYTITSLGGFESLINGVPVTTLGAPFYSGWGLTDDRQHVDRRQRELSLLEVFAAAYILYPRYRINDTKRKSNLNDSLVYLDGIIRQNQNLELFDSQQTRKIYNLATTHPLDLLYHKKSSSKKLAVISDSSDAMEFACDLTNHNTKKVDIFYHDTITPVSNEVVVPFEYLNSINLYSFEDNSALDWFSQLNKTTPDLQTISNTILHTLKSYVSEQLIPDTYLRIIAKGIEQEILFLYQIYNTAKSIIEEYDTIFIYADDLSSIQDLFYCLCHHANVLDFEGKINIALKNQKLSRDVARKGIKPKLKTDLTQPFDIPEEKRLFAKFWYDITLNQPTQPSYNQEGIVVCLSPDDASITLVKRLLSQSPLFSTNATLLLNEEVINDQKNEYDLLKSELPDNCDILNQQINDSKYSYSSYYAYRPQFIKYFSTILLSDLNKKLPKALIQILEKNIIKYSKDIFHIFFTLASFKHLLQNNKKVVFIDHESTTAQLLYKVSHDTGNNSSIIQSSKENNLSNLLSIELPPSIAWIDNNEKSRYRLTGLKQMTTGISPTNNMISHHTNKVSDMKKKTVMLLTHGLSRTIVLTIAKSINKVIKELGGSVVINIDYKFKHDFINRLKQCFDQTIDVKFVGSKKSDEKFLFSSTIILGMCTNQLYQSSVLDSTSTVCLIPTDEDKKQLKNLSLFCDDLNQIENYLEDLIIEGPNYKMLEINKAVFLKENILYVQSDIDTSMQEFVSHMFIKVDEKHFSTNNIFMET
ncbi:hypothetical protein VH441_01080 [Psychrobacter sp. HD31]|uniref:capsular polysaccharide export protein, LipB/KpsS family n=1 Tax=Psychrobacter sp. HD31 TaxID=3112003 RepID=UPI003DA612F0